MEKQKVRRLAKTPLIGTLALLLGSTGSEAQSNLITPKKETKDNMVVMLVTFEVRPEYLSQYRAALLDDLKNAKKEPGNISMELYRHRDKEHLFYFIERWENGEALEQHFQMPYTKRILELSKKHWLHP